MSANIHHSAFCILDGGPAQTAAVQKVTPTFDRWVFRLTFPPKPITEILFLFICSEETQKYFGKGYSFTVYVMPYIFTWLHCQAAWSSDVKCGMVMAPPTAGNPCYVDGIFGVWWGCHYFCHLTHATESQPTWLTLWLDEFGVVYTVPLVDDTIPVCHCSISRLVL